MLKKIFLVISFLAIAFIGFGFYLFFSINENFTNSLNSYFIKESFLSLEEPCAVQVINLLKAERRFQSIWKDFCSKVNKENVAEIGKQNLKFLEDHPNTFFVDTMIYKSVATDKNFDILPQLARNKNLTRFHQQSLILNFLNSEIEKKPPILFGQVLKNQYQYDILKKNYFRQLKNLYFVGKVKLDSDFSNIADELKQLNIQDDIKNIFKEGVEYQLRKYFGSRDLISNLSARLADTLIQNKRSAFHKIIFKEQLNLSDELSQYYYLAKSYEAAEQQSGKYIELDQQLKDDSFESRTNRLIVLARLGKSQFHQQKLKNAVLSLYELGKEYSTLKNDVKGRIYSDFSLASLLYKVGYKAPVSWYIAKSSADGYISKELEKKWVAQISIGEPVNLELDAYNEKFKKHKFYKSEIEQIKKFSE